MQAAYDDIADFWRDLSRAFRKVARGIYANTEYFLLSEPDDLAQRGLLAVQKFLDKRRIAGGGRLDLSSDLVREAVAYGVQSIKHAYIGEIRQARARAKKVTLVAGRSNEREGFTAGARRRQTTPEEILIASTMVGRIRKFSSSPRIQRIADGLLQALSEGGEQISPTDIAFLSGTSTNDMAYLRRRLAAVSGTGFALRDKRDVQDE